MTVRYFAQQIACTVSLLALSWWPATSLQAASLNDPNWDRHLALDLAQVTRVESQVERALRMLEFGRHADALQALREMSRRPDWMEPARDRAVFEFARALSGYSRQAVPISVLEFLTAYEPQTVVAHEEAIGIGVPLFPVRTVIAGVQNQWRMDTARIEAGRLIDTDPAALLTVYATSSDLPIRNGIRSAVSSSPAEDLKRLIQAGLPVLRDAPELTGLLGTAALALGDSEVYSAVVSAGSGAEMVGILRQAPAVFSAAELGRVMENSINHASVEARAVMIAEFSRVAASDPRVSKVLFKELGDNRTGSTAALALAQWGSETQIAQLRDKTALSNDSELKARVNRALSLTSGAAGGAQ